MDNSINLENLQAQLAARNGHIDAGADEETPIIGSFAAKMQGQHSTVVAHNYGNNNDVEATSMNSVPTTVNTEYGQGAVTNSGVVIDYGGPGLVVNNDELTDSSQTAPMYGVGINPSTVASLTAYMTEMDEDIEAARIEAESRQAERHNEKAETDDETDEDPGMTKDEFAQKYNEAVVIIDKSGFGKVINFTDEEHDKLEKVRKIKLEEVETVSLSSIRTKKAKKKDFDRILKRVANVTTTNIVLPMSGYTAEMKGCSAYELISLVDTNNNAMLSAQNKWSLIHSKIENTSIGKMDFNEFLMNTASNDYNTFIYGLLCSTYPDNDSIPLNCDKCKKQFDHNYSVRSLIRAEAMDEKLQDTIMTIVDNSITEQNAKRVHSEALISQVKRVKLPNSGIIAEIYVQSAYDLINKSIKALTDNSDEKYAQTAVLATLINNFYIPDPDEPGTYFEVSDGAEISKTIYTLNDVDVLVIRRLGDEMFNNMGISYGLMNVTCPHCGNYTPFIEMDIEQILFYRYRQAMSTLID